MSRDQLATRLLATFVGELEEQVRTMNADLLALEATPADAERLKSLFRVAHTLKGAARAAGVHLVEQVSAAAQQTSASTQEIAASAQALASTAEQLEQLVGRFRLNA